MAHTPSHKSKKYRVVKPTVIACEPYTAEEQETRFKKQYEFNKPLAARSPVTGWEDKYIREGTSMASPKEVALVKGTAAQFRGRRDKNSYGSRPTRRTVGRNR